MLKKVEGRFRNVNDFSIPPVVRRFSTILLSVRKNRGPISTFKIAQTSLARVHYVFIEFPRTRPSFPKYSAGAVLVDSRFSMDENAPLSTIIIIIIIVFHRINEFAARSHDD